MKVKVDVCELTEREDQEGNLDTHRVRICSDVENWDICETPQQVYRAAMKEYGRCTSKMFIDREDGSARHVGWTFVKRVKYTDCNETYLQETWICPLAKHEVKTIVEYALDRGRKMKNNEHDALYHAALEVLNDFDNCGEVLQTDEDGEYGPESAIEKLREAWAEAREAREKSKRG